MDESNWPHVLAIPAIPPMRCSQRSFHKIRRQIHTALMIQRMYLHTHYAG